MKTLIDSIVVEVEGDSEAAPYVEYLVNYLTEVDRYVRSYLMADIKWPLVGSVGYHAGNLTLTLDTPKAGYFWLDVYGSSERPIEMEVEIFGKGWAVCGVIDSYQFACASLMAFVE